MHIKFIYTFNHLVKLKDVKVTLYHQNIGFHILIFMKLGNNSLQNFDIYYLINSYVDASS